MWTFQAHKKWLKHWKVYYGRAGSLCYADFALIPRGSNGGSILSLSSIIMVILTHNIAHRSWAPNHTSLRTQVGTSATVASHPRLPRRTRCQLATRTVEDLWTATTMLWVMLMAKTNARRQQRVSFGLPLSLMSLAKIFRITGCRIHSPPFSLLDLKCIAFRIWMTCYWQKLYVGP